LQSALSLAAANSAVTAPNGVAAAVSLTQEPTHSQIRVLSPSQSPRSSASCASLSVTATSAARTVPELSPIIANIASASAAALATSSANAQRSSVVSAPSTSDQKRPRKRALDLSSPALAAVKPPSPASTLPTLSPASERTLSPPSKRLKANQLLLIAHIEYPASATPTAFDTKQQVAIQLPTALGDSVMIGRKQFLNVLPTHVLPL
jgi:hypothetical protein